VLQDGLPIAPHELPIQRAARGETVSGQAVDLKFDDGTTLHVLVSAHPLYEPTGVPRGAVACILDVTDLKVVEKTLRHHDRRKDEFLATLAHELRNPLAPIVAGLEVMQMAPNDAETVERARQTIDRQVQHLVMLVDDLLDVSRITQGKFELRKRDVDLSEIVEVAVEASLPAIQRAGLRLATDLPEEPVRLTADPHRLAQVLTNLLSNAVKYTPAGGRIDLRVAVAGAAVDITVADTGIGIPPEMADGIFDMFTQIDRPQERGHPGLGVGLTLAKVLVGMHGGTIGVTSEGTDKGSTFTVRLPLGMDQPRERSAPELPDGVGSARTRRVLVVDDNEAMVEALTTMLQLMGSEVRTAFNGRAALEVAAEFRPDTVLMDLGMPVMSGYEAARHLRAQPWGGDIQLVALTGWDQEDHKERSAQAGFDVHVVKPVRPADLERLFAKC
jgi:signal transduction histidine kinase